MFRHPIFTFMLKSGRLDRNICLNSSSFQTKGKEIRIRTTVKATIFLRSLKIAWFFRCYEAGEKKAGFTSSIKTWLWDLFLHFLLSRHRMFLCRFVSELIWPFFTRTHGSFTFHIWKFPLHFIYVSNFRHLMTSDFFKEDQWFIEKENTRKKALSLKSLLSKNCSFHEIRTCDLLIWRPTLFH